MKSRFAPATFVVTFCCAYIAVFALDWPLFQYYPLHGDFTWGNEKLTDAGPGMAWYGLLASAGIVATVAALCVPDRMIDGPLHNYLWLFPVGAMLGCVFLLRGLFV